MVTQSINLAQFATSQSLTAPYQQKWLCKLDLTVILKIPRKAKILIGPTMPMCFGEAHFTLFSVVKSIGSKYLSKSKHDFKYLRKSKNTLKVKSKSIEFCFLQFGLLDCHLLGGDNRTER